MLFSHLPFDTKLLLTKNYFEIIIFEKLRISRVISGKSLSFLETLRVQIPSKITKNNSQGIIFAIISCQRVVFCQSSDLNGRGSDQKLANGHFANRYFQGGPGSDRFGYGGDGTVRAILHLFLTGFPLSLYIGLSLSRSLSLSVIFLSFFQSFFL